MPFDNIAELPDMIQNTLPKHAQEIYKSAFNSAWEEYADPRDRRGDDSREEVASKVAWAAVKHKYEKKEGKWQKKEEK